MNCTFQNIVRTLSLLATGAAAGAAHAGPAAETNFWPGTVTTTFNASEAAPEQKALGPLIFSSPAQGAKPLRQGFRPLWVETVDRAQGRSEFLALYPLFRYESDAEGARWSLFSLVRQDKPAAREGQAAAEGSFEVWPFLLRRHEPAKGDDYTALFPLHGQVTHRFGLDRWDFTLFPLYSRSEKSGRVVTQTPWPVLRRIEGAGHHGFEFWPLYGERGRDKDYQRSFYLWPLGYSSTRWNEDGTAEKASGFLPFYARSSGPQHQSETYVWPFFGYSDRKGPKAYHQTDYFWPLFVQGRGDVRHLNRWAPFYTHSRSAHGEKTWYLWPLYRQETLRFADLEENDRRVLFFLYRSTTQHRPGAPAAGTARRTHLWPLFSRWDNGRGQVQLQFLSPLEPAFPNNEPLRLSYSPLFALYRFHRLEGGQVRHSALWDLLTLTREPGQTAWHVGPLAEGRTGETGRYSLLSGLLGLERKPEGWRPFVFKFQRQATAASTP